MDKLMKFPLGRVVATQAILTSLTRADLVASLRRHISGDWGNLCPEDKLANDEALAKGGRLLSSYLSDSGEKFWIITEADRSVTTFLLPSEY